MKQMSPLQTAGKFCLAGIFKDAQDSTVSAALNNIDPTGGEAVAWKSYTLEGDQVAVRKELASHQIISGTFDLGQVIFELIAATGEQVTKGTPDEVQWKLFGLIGPAAIYCTEAAFWLDGTVGGQIGTLLRSKFHPAAVPLTTLASRPSAIKGDYTLYKRAVTCNGANNQCYTERMQVRITCARGSCTIIRTNGSSAANLQPWTVAIPLNYNGHAWQGSGNEPDAAACSHKPVPAAVQLTLTTASGGAVNGVWAAQQIVGTYTVAIESPGACSGDKGVFLLSTASSFVPYRYKNPKSLNLLQLQADLAYFKTAMSDFAASAKLNSQQSAELGDLTRDLAGCEADPNPLNPECGSYLIGVVSFLQPAKAN